MSLHDASNTILLTSSSLDFTTTGVKFKWPHLQGLRIKRWGILLNAAPGDAGTIQLRKVDQASAATVLSTITLATTHTADDLVYGELTGTSDTGIGSPGATPLVAANEYLDVNVDGASASVSAVYVVVEASVEPAEPNANTNVTETA